MKKTLDATTYQNAEQELYDALTNADVQDWQDVRMVTRDILGTHTSRSEIDAAMDAVAVAAGMTPAHNDVAGAILALLFDVQAAGPSLPLLCANAGYYRFVDTTRLLADLRLQPGCAKLTSRTLQNYLYGTGKVPAHVITALSIVLSVPVEVIVQAVTR